MDTRSAVLQLLEENKSTALSGQQIAGMLGVTRAAVWKAVKSLQEDGYSITATTNKGYVLIRGQKAPIRGRICMDQMMVDVTDIPDADYGDRVVLIGRDGDEFLPVETLSDLSGRFNYEFVCDLGKRIPREFIRHGEVVEQMDWF